MSDIRLVRAGEEHLPAITDIYNEAVRNSTATFDTEPRTLEDRRRWLSAHGDLFPVLVALTPEGQVAAWGCVSPYSERPAYRFTVEDSLYVREGLRGQGIGSLLLRRLLELAAAGGYHTVIARVVGDNVASLSVHQKHGFVSTGTLREVGFKFDRWLDVTFLQRIL